VRWIVRLLTANNTATKLSLCKFARIFVEALSIVIGAYSQLTTEGSPESAMIAKPRSGSDVSEAKVAFREQPLRLLKPKVSNKYGRCFFHFFLEPPTQRTWAHRQLVRKTLNGQCFVQMLGHKGVKIAQSRRLFLLPTQQSAELGLPTGST
jgi:hypothetical protein